MPVQHFLYFIADAVDPEFKRDLFTVAETPDEAIQQWRDHWPEWMESDDEIPERVFVVGKSGGEKGPLDWHSPRLRQVAGTLEC